MYPADVRLRHRPHRLKGKVIAIDTETTGLRAYHGDRLFCFAYLTDKGEWGFIPKSKAAIDWFNRTILQDPSKTVVFHSAKFDLTMFMQEGIDIFNIKARVECTLTMSKVLYSTAPAHDLLTLAKKFLGRQEKDKVDIVQWVKRHNMKKELRKRGGKRVGFIDAPEELVRARVLWDVKSTLMLHRYLVPKAYRICPDLYETERRLIFVCIDMERRGVQVDITMAKALRAHALRDIASIHAELNALVLPLTMTKRKRKQDVEVELEQFNPGSRNELVAAFQKLHILLKYKTKPKKGKKGGARTGGGNWTFDEYAMMRYVSRPLAEVMRKADENAWPAGRFVQAVKTTIIANGLRRCELLPPLVLKYRELSKMVSTYYDHIINDAVDIHKTAGGREIGTLHCRFNPAEAMTGRFSSSDINLQNLPRILGPRQCFVTRKGRRNWHLDYDQVEMRFFVHFARDPKMAKAIDDDIHKHTAAAIYHISLDKVTKEQRKRAKGTNFGIIYGSGPPTQAETLTKKGLPTTILQATELVANYHIEFPSVRRTTASLKRQIHRDGYIVNPKGRRYYIPPRFSYKALNYLCQGTSADLLKAAMVKIWEWLRDNEMQSQIIMTIHDEIVIECPPIEERKAIPHIIKLMEDKYSFFVPITVSAEVAPRRWSQKLVPNKVGCDFI